MTEFGTRATAREKQRDLVAAGRSRQLEMMEQERARTERTLSGLVGTLTPLAVLVAALFVGLMVWLNVRDRRPEIGLLRALGKRVSTIALLFLGKSAVLGLLGGLAGAAVGYLLASTFGQSQFQLAGGMIRLDPRLLVAILAGAPLVACLASYLPTLLAVRQDPAVVLMDS